MKKIMFFFAATLMMVACSNEEVAVNDEVQYVTELTANLGGGDTRMAVTHNPASGLSFAWENKEVLYIYQADDASVQYTCYKYDSETGKFKVESGNEPMVAGTKYFATNQIDNFTIVDGMPVFNANLNYAESIESLPLISDVFTADASGTIVTMHHTVGVVEVPVLLDESSTYTTLTNLGFYVSAGNSSGSFTATPGTPYFKEATSGNGGRITWANMGEKVLNKTTATSFFIPMLPGSYTDAGLNYNYEKNSGETSKQRKVSGTFNVVCGKITKLAEQTLKLID